MTVELVPNAFAVQLVVTFQALFVLLELGLGEGGGIGAVEQLQHAGVAQFEDVGARVGSPLL